MQVLDGNGAREAGGKMDGGRMVAIEVESAGEEGVVEWPTSEDDGAQGGDISVEDGDRLGAVAAGDLEMTAADFGLEAVVAEA
jgi:hypothetical protein